MKNKKPSLIKAIKNNLTYLQSAKTKTIKERVRCAVERNTGFNYFCFVIESFSVLVCF